MMRNRIMSFCLNSLKFLTIDNIIYSYSDSTPLKDLDREPVTLERREEGRA